MKKLSIIWVLCQLNNTQLLAQNEINSNNLNSDTAISNTFNLDFTSLNKAGNRDDIFVGENYFMTCSYNEKKINVVFFNEHEVLSKQTIKFDSEERRKFLSRWIPFFHFSNNQLIVQVEDKIKVYSINTKNFDLLLTGTYESEKMGSYYFDKKDELYSYDTYPKRSRQEYNSFILKFNKDTKQQTYTELTCNVPIFGVSGASNLIAFNNNSYLVGQTEKYQIDIYDYQHKKIDSVHFNDSSYFVEMSKSKIDELKPLSLNIRDIVSTIPTTNKLYEEYSLLQKINFINDTTLFVQLTQPDSTLERKFTFENHVLKKRKGSWQIIRVFNKKDFNNNEDVKISEKDIMPYFFFDNRLKFANNQLYYFYWSDNRIDIKDNPTQKDYFNTNIPEENLILRLTKIQL